MAVAIDRAQSHSPGAEAVSVESAVAESVVLRGAASSGTGRFASRLGGYGAFSRYRRQASDCHRTAARQSGGVAAGAADAGQARVDVADPQEVAGRSSASAAGPSAAAEGCRVSACLLCGSTRLAPLFRGSDRLYHTTRREFDVVRCGDCGLVRLNPQPSPEELQGYYPSNYWFA